MRFPSAFCLLNDLSQPHIAHIAHMFIRFIRSIYISISFHVVLLNIQTICTIGTALTFAHSTLHAHKNIQSFETWSDGLTWQVMLCSDAKPRQRFDGCNMNKRTKYDVSTREQLNLRERIHLQTPAVAWPSLVHWHTTKLDVGQQLC